MPTSISARLSHRLSLIAERRGISLEALLESMAESAEAALSADAEPSALQLSRREQEFRAMVENNTDLIARFAPDFRYLYVNPTHVRASSKPPETFVGKHISEVGNPPEIVAWIEERLKAVMKLKGEVQTRFETTTEDGTIIVFEGGMTPIFDEQGEIESILSISRDVSLRARMERDLHESESRFRGIVESQIDLVCRYAPDTTLTYINDAYSKFFGIERENMLGKSFLPNVAESSMPFVLQRMKELEKNPAPFVNVTMNLDANGEPRFVQWVDHGITDRDGRLVEVQAVGRDITPLKRVEAELQALNHRLEMIMQGSPEAIVTQDVEGRVSYWNPACERTFGWKSEEVLGNFLPYINEAGVREEARMLFSRIQAGETVEGYETRRRRRDGKMIDVSLSIAPLFDYQGNFDGTVAVLSDITQRKQAERDLLAQKEVLQSIIDNIPVILIIMDVKLRVQMVNQAFERALGMDYARAVNEYNLLPIFYPDIVYRKTVLEAIISADGQWRDFKVTKPDGAVVDITWATVRLSDGRRISIGRDITDRKQLEEQRLYAHALELELTKEREIIELRERFTSMISHEFRTPLSIIASSVQMIRNYHKRMPEIEIVERLEGINTQVQEMVIMLDDVLEVSRTNVQPRAFYPEPLDVVPFCRKHMANLILIDGGRHQFVMNAEKNWQIMADHRLLEHILTNLLTNAMKYSPPHTTITINLREDGEYLCLCVKDQGIGIPEEDHESIFKTFYRARNANIAHGTGLGLAIVRQNVELHGGTISFETEIGKGTTFIVHLPLPPTPPEDTP